MLAGEMASGADRVAHSRCDLDDERLEAGNLRDLDAVQEGDDLRDARAGRHRLRARNVSEQNAVCTQTCTSTMRMMAAATSAKTRLIKSSVPSGIQKAYVAISEDRVRNSSGRGCKGRQKAHRT